MSDQPFWEASYRNTAERPFGPPAVELLDLAGRMPPGSLVLDLGCGDGRNALALAERGFKVEAIDISEAGIDKLRRRAAERSLELNAKVGDITALRLSREYDLIVAHGVLHLLDRKEWSALLDDIQTATRPGGWNVVVVFTDRLPPPDDLAPHAKGLFREGELSSRYRTDSWIIEEDERYTLRDRHPSGESHIHPVNRIVAQRLSDPG